MYLFYLHSATGIELFFFAEEESEEESEEEEEEEAADVPMEGIQTPSGLETPSGMASVVSTVAGGLETPDFLELRKNARPSADADDSGPRSLYHVVPEKQTNVRGFMGSERGYDVSAVAGSALPVLGDERATKVRDSCNFIYITFAEELSLKQKKGGVDVTLDASELEGLTEEELKRKYDASARGSAGVPGGKEDFSDMVAKEMAKKKQKMEREREGKRDNKFKF